MSLRWLALQDLLMFATVPRLLVALIPCMLAGPGRSTITLQTHCKIQECA